MPNVTIEIRRHYARAEEEAIIAAVHAALMEGSLLGFKVDV